MADLSKEEELEELLHQANQRLEDAQHEIKRLKDKAATKGQRAKFRRINIAKQKRSERAAAAAKKAKLEDMNKEIEELEPIVEGLKKQIIRLREEKAKVEKDIATVKKRFDLVLDVAIQKL